MMDYDYWGLFHLMYPNAERRFDLMAKRDIGIISANTRVHAPAASISPRPNSWVIARLMWNPDLEVEQLRRYFNRRAFREAAPWMDRFFGVMREAFRTATSTSTSRTTVSWRTPSQPRRRRRDA